MSYSRLLILPVCFMLLQSCGEGAPTPDPAQDWVDVPLSDNTYAENKVPWRRGVYDIYVAAYNALEFKLRLQEGDGIVYHWNAEMTDPALLTAEFHGHTERADDAAGKVMFYKIHTDGRESGALTAPFDGIHGWYLNNTSSEDIVVVLEVAGFYEEVE